MDETVSVEMLVKVAVISLGMFAAIFVLAVITPWLAKHVDNWIERYRSNHSAEHDELYSVRSIYELPPRKKPAAPSAQEPEASGDTADKPEQETET